jgi:hypothetical protein
VVGNGVIDGAPDAVDKLLPYAVAIDPGASFVTVALAADTRAEMADDGSEGKTNAVATIVCACPTVTTPGPEANFAVATEVADGLARYCCSG